MAATTVVVTNISPALEERHLRELFECCGQIRDLKIQSSEPRICTIEFNDPSHAQAAILLSGTPLGDRPLEVKSKSDADATLQTLLQQLLARNASGPTATAAVTETLGLSSPLIQAAKRKQEEVARTVYVGNLNFDTTAETLKNFFEGCGDISYVKLVGDTAGWTGRYAFIEFKSQEGANAALGLTGTVIGDRAVKVGRSNNPIIKQGGVDLSGGERKKNLDEIMERVKAATTTISDKVERRSRSRSRDRKKKRSKRSRSRSGGRKRRSRSRERRRSRSRDRSRERRRERRREEEKEMARRSPPKAKSWQMKKEKEKIDRTGMFFDGYTWQPIVDVAIKNPGAVLLAQHPSHIRRQK